MIYFTPFAQYPDRALVKRFEDFLGTGGQDVSVIWRVSIIFTHEVYDAVRAYRV